MEITSLYDGAGFVVVDLDAPSVPMVGVARCARKVLRDGATNLARAATYGLAAIGVDATGCSVGIDAEGDARDDTVSGALAALFALRPDAVLSPGKGLTTDDLANAGFGWLDTTERDERLVHGVVTAVTGMFDLAGTTIAVEPGAPCGDVVAARLAEAGATVLTAAIPSGRPDTPPPDVWIVGSRNAVIDHHNVAFLSGSAIVASAPLAVSTRALAVANREGARVLPDFVTSVGPLTVGILDRGSFEDAFAAAMAPVLEAGDRGYLAACELAEAHLDDHRHPLPFGRPMP
ncbi:MAG: hypothetical protein R2698_11300 [Microthrixaceae bacterium]